MRSRIASRSSSPRSPRTSTRSLPRRTGVGSTEPSSAGSSTASGPTACRVSPETPATTTISLSWTLTTSSHGGRRLPRLSQRCRGALTSSACLSRASARSICSASGVNQMPGTTTTSRRQQQIPSGSRSRDDPLRQQRRGLGFTGGRRCREREVRPRFLEPCPPEQLHPPDA